MSKEYFLEKIALNISKEQLLQAIANRASKVRELTKVPQAEALETTLMGSEEQLKRLGATLEGTGREKAREIAYNLIELPKDLPIRYTKLKPKYLDDRNTRNELLERMGDSSERWTRNKENLNTKVTRESIVKALINRAKKTGEPPEQVFEKAKPQLQSIFNDSSKILREPDKADFSRGRSSTEKIVNFLKDKYRKEEALTALHTTYEVTPHTKDDKMFRGGKILEEIYKNRWK